VPHCGQVHMSMHGHAIAHAWLNVKNQHHQLHAFQLDKALAKDPLNKQKERGHLIVSDDGGNAPTTHGIPLSK
jgi:hypothetical protein